MEYRKLGDSDLNVSTFGLGGNTFGPPRLEEAMSVRCIHAAIDAGVNFVDTANIYGEKQSEIFLGNALNDRRDKMMIATKFNFRGFDVQPGAVRQFMADACDESLRKLQTDYIDLYQLHFADPKISPEETVQGFEDLRAAGKIRWYGEVGSHSWKHMQYRMTADALGVQQPVSTQNALNLFLRQAENEQLPLCNELNVGFIVIQALLGGFLTDKYVKGEPPPPGSRGAAGSPMVTRTRTPSNDEKQDQLKTWAHEHDHTLGELAFAWLLDHSEVTTVLAGVSTPDQVEENKKAVEWKLTPEQRVEVDKLVLGDNYGDQRRRGPA